MIIYFLDGTEVSSSDLTLDWSSYRVWLGTENVTNEIRQSDKVKIWPGFSREKDNLRAHAEQQARRGEPVTPTGSTSTWDIFWNQIITDPLEAPLDYADDKITGRLFASTTVRLLLIGGAVYLAWRMGLLKKWIK